jgi:hypothetical protein
LRLVSVAPVSVASLPGPGSARFVLKAHPGFSQRLLQVARRHPDQDLRAFISSPYGSPPLNIAENERFSHSYGHIDWSIVPPPNIAACDQQGYLYSPTILLLDRSASFTLVLIFLRHSLSFARGTAQRHQIMRAGLHHRLLYCRQFSSYWRNLTFHLVQYRQPTRREKAFGKRHYS